MRDDQFIIGSLLILAAVVVAFVVTFGVVVWYFA